MYPNDRRSDPGPSWIPAVHSVWNPQTGRIRVYDKDGYTLLAEGHGDQAEARRLVGEAKRRKEESGMPLSKYPPKQRRAIAASMKSKAKPKAAKPKPKAKKR